MKIQNYKHLPPDMRFYSLFFDHLLNVSIEILTRTKLTRTSAQMYSNL
jgi:hypothetical protein